MVAGDSEHWGPGHHLAHLTRTSLAIARGLGSGTLPAHSHGRSRSYTQVLEAATTTLGATPRDRLLEMGRVVEVATGTRRDELVSSFAAASASLRAAAGSWDEAALDRQAMRHPLLGELTVREMLLFCVFHERHHLRLVRERMAA